MEERAQRHLRGQTGGSGHRGAGDVRDGAAQALGMVAGVELVMGMAACWRKLPGRPLMVSGETSWNGGGHGEEAVGGMTVAHCGADVGQSVADSGDWGWWRCWWMDPGPGSALVRSLRLGIK